MVVLLLALQSSKPKVSHYCVSLSRNILPVGGDIPVDSEAHVVTSSISRSNPLAQYLGGVHMRGCVYMGECMHVYVRTNMALLPLTNQCALSPPHHLLYIGGQGIGY